ncbi:MAG: hypothetical protein AAFN17_05160 [Pseudomonadota bacterium]
MTKVEEERIKLSAAYLNGVAVSTLAIGLLAPAVGIAAGSVAAADTVLIALMMAALFTSFCLHCVDRGVLGRLA